MNILITSIGRRSYMVEYFKNALSGNDKIFAINSEKTYALTQADSYEICPNIYDESYVDFVLQYCLKNNIGAILSLFDIDLPILSKNKFLFEQHNITLIISDYEFIQVCNDKWLTYNYLRENNFNTPKSFLSLDDVYRDLKTNILKFPLIIKPRWGMGSIGVSIAENENDLEFYYNKTLETIEKSYLIYESRSEIEKAIIIQEKLDGEEYGLDVFNSLQGEYIATVPKKKIAMRAGETDIAEVQLNEQLIQYGKRLSAVTKHIGNMDVDVFNINGDFYVLEMNARFGGQYPFSHLAGVNFPKVIVDQLKNTPINLNDVQFSPITGSKDFVIHKL